MKNFINEKTVMEFYLEQIYADKILFLQNKEECKKQVRELIEQLLKEDKMNNKIAIASRLWKVLFEASMTFIDPDKSGYDKLFKYFDAYVEFEELIFASDSFYRDHTLHCIWVYLLGEYLKRKEEFHELFADSEATVNVVNAIWELLKRAEEVCKGEAEFRKSEFERFEEMRNVIQGIWLKDDAIRCLTALTHDLGYPLKKIEKINKSIKKVLPYFSISAFDDFTFHYENMQQEFIKNFIDFISRDPAINVGVEPTNEGAAEKLASIIVVDKHQHAVGVNYDVLNSLTKEEYLECLRSMKYSQYFPINMAAQFGYWNDFEEYRHGIMSAFLLCKNLRAFQNINYDTTSHTFSYKRSEELESMLCIQSVLASITNHTSERFRITSLEPSTFLTFVDELEEFSRISRASQNREYVEEFCDTALYMEDGWLNIVFEFNNTKLDNLDPEISFKGRCKRFLSLFDIGELSENLKLRVQCVGKLPSNQNTYCLEIARKHADIMINGQSVNIPKYLKVNQFYTKEEYAM